MVEETEDYDTAIAMLKTAFVKPKNIVFAGHILATRTQKQEESLPKFLQPLLELAKNCKFDAVTAEQYRKEMTQDSFINDLCSANIQQRLLKNDELTLERAFDLTLSIDCAQEQLTEYINPATAAVTQLAEEINLEMSTNAAARETQQRASFVQGKYILVSSVLPKMLAVSNEVRKSILLACAIGVFLKKILKAKVPVD